MSDAVGGRLRLALEILTRIPYAEAVTAKALHSSLREAAIHVSLRTVQRVLNEDLVPLCGIVCQDERLPYRYVWPRQGVAWPQRLQSPQDSMLVAVARAHLALHAPPTLPANHDWAHKLAVVDTPVCSPKVREEVLSAISEALHHDLEVDLRCQHEAQPTTHVQPLGLLHSQGRFDLIAGFDGVRRCWPLEEVEDVQVSDRHFQRPQDFDLQHLLKQRIRFLAKAALRDAIDRHPQLIPQSIQPHELGLEVRAHVLDSAAVEQWLHTHRDDILNVDKTIGDQALCED